MADQRGRVLLADPRGYCAGVDRAVVAVEKALELHGPPIYVRKEIVHNRHVVTSLQDKGAIFVEETDAVPEGATVIQVDLRGEHLGRRVPLELGLVGDVKDTIDALLPRLAPRAGRTF